MAIQDRIKDVVETLYPSGTYLLASRFFSDRESYDLDSTDMPMIILNNQLSKSNTINVNSNLSKETRIEMWFLSNDAWDVTPAETDVICESMEAIADNIYLQIYQFDEVRGEGLTFETERVFHVFNSNLSGVYARARWVENATPSWCPVPPVVPPVTPSGVAVTFGWTSDPTNIIKDSDTTITNPFTDKMPKEVVLTTEDGVILLDGYRQINQTTGDVTINLGANFNNLLISLIGW